MSLQTFLPWARRSIPSLLFLFVFFVYVTHLSQGVYGGDSGDFIGAIVSHGIPHPSGYPLFVLLGIIANSLPFTATAAWKIGLISAVFGAGTVLLLYAVLTLLTKRIVLGLVGSLTLAFFYLFWLQAEVVEVFTLTAFFFMLLFFLSIRYRETLAKKYIYFISLFLGLSFANHEITVIVVPSLLLLVLSANWRLIREWKTVLLSISLFFVGLLPYLYIPLAASLHPVINWDNAVTFQNFLHLVLRKDYGWSVNTATDMTSRFLAVKTLAERLLIELTPPGIVLILLGMVEMLRKKMFALFAAVFLGFFLAGPFYVVYGLTPLLNDYVIGVLERFYMLSALFLVIFLPFGVSVIVNFLDRLIGLLPIDKQRRIFYSILFTALFLLLPGMLFRFNSPKTDLHSVWIGDNLGTDLVSPVAPNSFLVLNTDNVFFNSQYIQLAKGVRKDVVIANLIYLPQNSLFVMEKKHITSTLSQQSTDYRTLLQILKSHPIYAWSNFEVSKKKEEQFTWIPFGLGYKIADEKDLSMTEGEFIMQQEAIWQTFHIPFKINLSAAESGLTISEIPGLYSGGLINIAYYLRTHYHDFQKAKEYYVKAIAVDPQSELGYLGIGFTEIALHNCSSAQIAFGKELSINPTNKQAYLGLFVLNQTCLHDTALGNRLSTEFKNLFHEPIQRAALDAIQSDSSFTQ